MRYFVFAAEEPQPRCPLAVVRLDDDGTEQAFTRALRWVESDDGLARVGGELPPNVWEVSPQWAEVFLVDMIREMRERRHGERRDPLLEGVWGHLGGGPRIDLSDGEARLVAREREDVEYRWFVPRPTSPQFVARVGPDGVEERFTSELCWGPPPLLRLARMQEVSREQAMAGIHDLVRRVRELWQQQLWSGQYDYFAWFFGGDVLDLTSARSLIRRRGSGAWDPEQVLAHSGEWVPTDRVAGHHRGRSELGEPIAISPEEAEHLEVVLRERHEQWRRAYGN